MIPSFVIGKPVGAVNDKVNLALVGSGGIAKTAFGDCRRENVVAISEVDDVSGSKTETEFYHSELDSKDPIFRFDTIAIGLNASNVGLERLNIHSLKVFKVR